VLLSQGCRTRRKEAVIDKLEQWWNDDYKGKIE
jgi:hypothetical protein